MNYDMPTEDLKDWYVVDALDGRRWIGKIVATFLSSSSHYNPPDPQYVEIPLAPDELVLRPAFEFYPDKIAMVHPVPDVNPLTQEMTPKAMTFHSCYLEFDSLLCLAGNGLPPQRLRYAGLSACADWAPKRRAEMARVLGKTMKLQDPDLPTRKTTEKVLQ